MEVKKDQPIGSEFSILEDENGDGKWIRAPFISIFGLMPRALGLIKGGALIAENNSFGYSGLDGEI